MTERKTHYICPDCDNMERLDETLTCPVCDGTYVWRGKVE